MAHLTCQADEEIVFAANPVLVDRATHYCPGCQHGIAHRLVTEIIHELDLAPKTIGVASVGCSAFIYNYMNLDWIESPHGRASAVATGVKRAKPEKFVFAYQGDGDLGAIGFNEAIQAANRGEHISVFFINNTVYGMTGGQMAPTTLIGQKTTTTPFGRSPKNEGSPMRVAEMMAGLDCVAYAARCSLDSVKNILAAKKSMKKAVQVQLDGIGYGFVELLSGCPTNWRLDPLAARDYIKDKMQPVFPLGVFKDITKEAN